GGEGRGEPQRAGAVEGVEAPLAPGLVEHHAAGERVEEGPWLAGRPDEEVPRHADAGQGQAEPAPDLDGDDGEGDRQTRAARDDLVEERVARVVVVVGVPDEAEVGEEMAPQPVE